MKSQMEMFKPIIWHLSLTSVFTECPYCGSENSEKGNICTVCEQVLDVINPIYKKSKDFLECERLGLKGPVYRDEKGKWVKSNI